MPPAAPLARLVLAITLISSHFALAATPEFPLSAGRNAVRFNDAHPAADFVGMGFVLEHAGRHFAVTAKHVLLVVNHPQLRSVDPAPVVSAWHMEVPGLEAPALGFGALLNADPDEALDLQVLQRDALVCAVDHPGPFTALKIAAKEPRPGERLYALGCTFATAESCRQDVYAGTLVGQAEHNWLIDLGATDPATLRGLSGGPVVNAAGEVVGIVSNVLPDGDGIPRFAPARLDYLRSVLAELPVAAAGS